MGVPHLSTLLSPYAVLTSLGCERLNCSTHHSGLRQRGDSDRLIIDGPSFVYEVYYRLLDRSTNDFPSPNPLNAIPSYDEIGRSALSFLAALERCGLTMYECGRSLHLVQASRAKTDAFEPQVKRSFLMDSFRRRKRTSV